MTFETFHFRRIAWLGVLLMLAVLVTPAWAQSSPPEQSGGDDGPVNATCLVTTDEAVDPRFTAVYEGKTIGFCCRKCLTKFQADPTAYVTNLPASFSPAAQDAGDPHEHADHDEGHEHADVAPPASANAGTHEAEHEHSHESEGRSTLAVWIGKFHPPATHVPIGLLIGAAVAEIGMIVTRKEWFRHAAGFCLALGTLGALGAATLGWFNGGVALWDSDWVQATHRWLGTGTAALSVVTLVFYLRMTRAKSGSHPAFWYRASLFITTSLVGAAGFFGGALVYGINHYAW